MLIEITLNFPWGKTPQTKFSMEMSRIPQRGEWIGQSDGQFGTRYRAFVKEVEKDCRFVFGGHPQYVKNIGYRDGKHVLEVSCNPENYILAWNSLSDKKICILESKCRPQVGDWICDDRGKDACVKYVTIVGENLIFMELSESEVTSGVGREVVELSMAVHNMADDIHDIVQRVQDIYYNLR